MGEKYFQQNDLDGKRDYLEARISIRKVYIIRTKALVDLSLIPIHFQVMR
jgi:hypothetical protein